jgi:hypothetical protein
MKKILTFYVLLFISCATGPKPAPSWVMDYPTSPDAWIGIGYVTISGDEYREIARNKAIEQIAAQIKVHIKSSLTIITTEVNYKVDEFAEEILQSRVNMTLEDVIIVDSYSTGEKYYVLARLNKQQYFERLKKETDEATLIAQDLIIKSENGPSIGSLSNYVKAIKAISPFLDQFPVVSYQGSDQKIYPLLLRLFRGYNDRYEINVSPARPSIKALIDENVPLFITVKNNHDNSAIADVPIDVRWVGGTESFRIVTNENGNATFVLDRHWAVDKNQILSFHMNYDAFMDPEVEPLIDYNTPVKEVNVDVVGPKIFFSYDISNLDEKVAVPNLPAAVKKHFINNFSSEFVAKRNFADLELKLIVSIIEKSERINENYPHMIYANGRIEIVNIATGETILSNNIKTKGGDFNSKEVAGIRAIDNLAKEFGSNDLFSTKKE